MLAEEQHQLLSENTFQVYHGFASGDRPWYSADCGLWLLFLSNQKVVLIGSHDLHGDAWHEFARETSIAYYIKVLINIK
jgi:hypothetical protein